MNKTNEEPAKTLRSGKAVWLGLAIVLLLVVHRYFCAGRLPPVSPTSAGLGLETATSMKYLSRQHRGQEMPKPELPTATLSGITDVIEGA